MAIDKPSPGRPAKIDGNARKAIIAAGIGNMLEWYDFGVYAFLVPIISTEFFPSGDATTSLLATFAAYGVGFLARPVGAIVLGRLGDTKGRKFSLILTFTLMALATAGLGLIPTYSQIGIISPISLIMVRLIQGFAAGGNFGTGTSFIVEWAPEGRRGFVGSFQQVSDASGFLLGSAFTALLETLIPDASLHSWGWRIPFLLGIILLVVGLYIRRRVVETPVFEAKGRVETTDTAYNGPKLAFRAFAFTIFWTVGYYVLISYMPTFTRTYGGLSESQALWSNTIGILAMVVTIPIFGHISDQVGRRPFLIASVVAATVFSYPLFWVIVSKPGFVPIVIVQAAFGLILAMFSGPGPAALCEIFPTHLRSTWMSIGYTFATTIFGGFAPFTATLLISQTGSALSPSFGYLIPTALITLSLLLILQETAKSDLA